MAFDGMRVLALESRRATEMAELIRRQGGAPFVAPSMRERPLESNAEAIEFGEKLYAGEYDMMILLTGVGTRTLNRVLSAHFPENAFADALRKLTVAARGPKPVSALREMGVTPAVVAPEPNTWHELAAALKDRTERRIAVQEYGNSATGLLETLRGRGAEVTPVRVYHYDLPEDTGPLREAVGRLAAGDFPAVLFTTSMQVVHLFRIAEEEDLAKRVRDNLARAAVASIGPTTTETLEEFGIRPDITASHPKMGFLVKEAAEQTGAVLARKNA